MISENENATNHHLFGTNVEACGYIKNQLNLYFNRKNR